MRALLLYPQYPDTFWGFKHALRFIAKKASQPPLGLLTVAAMLPHEWEKRLVDTNVSALKDKDLKWADIVFLSAMSVQKASARELIARCRRAGVRIVAGGPLFTTNPEEFADTVDHLLRNEAELTLPQFLHDLKHGRAAAVYESDDFADVTRTPVPLWNLLDRRKYAAMNIQYSRGCPFDCEFCDISVLYGKRVRTKSKEQVVAELDALYSRGWRGDVFFVDDNFIGNKKKLKSEILPAVTEWMGARRWPFAFQTEASIDLADDAELMGMMVGAGFDSVFVGIETTNEDSLLECNKQHNRNRDLLACVKSIQDSGLRVMAGFILGFDSDPPSIFGSISSFVERSGIVSAMVGLLNAPRHTRLYRRLAEEGRLLGDGSGDSMDGSLNFRPRMDHDRLIEGYRTVIHRLYSTRAYYERVRKFLRECRPPQRRTLLLKISHVRAFLRSTIVLGVFGRERFCYWKLLLWTLVRRPRLFPLAVSFAIYGFHFRKFFAEYL